MVYTPAPGTVMPAGVHTLSVTFTPSDPAQYQAATATVSLTVNKARPAVVWPSPAPITFGTPLSTTQLNAAAGGVEGKFTYSPCAGSVLGAGTQTLSATFTPSDGANFQAVSITVPLIVNKVRPVIQWPVPAPIVHGTALSAMQLDAVASRVAGSFTYSPPLGSILAVGQHTLSAIFNPSDAQDYETLTETRTLTVRDATPPAITAQPQNQTANLGEVAGFSVAATGADPLAYQWYRNSVSIPGATSASYTTPPVRAVDNGASFSVLVSDSSQSTRSTSARLTVTAPPQSSYYIAPTGSDQADGSAVAPFATLQRAQQAMQATLTKRTQIAEGTYYLTAPLVLTSADQGETWDAAPGATPTLNGGAALTGWTRRANGVYTAHAAFPVGLDLTVSGVRQLPAALSFNPDEPFISGWRVLLPIQDQTISDTFSVNAADLTESVKPGALVQIIDHFRWTDFFTRIVSVDAAHSTVTVALKFDTGTFLGYAGSWRVLNDPVDLSGPGQFAYDAASSTVYLWPGASDDLGSARVVAAQAGTLIDLKNTSGITISGLTFSDTASNIVDASGTRDDMPAAIVAAGLSNSTISGNTFLNVGRGIALSGSSDNTIAGNSFQHLGVSGINLSSNSNRNAITNNSLKDIGAIDLGSYAMSINNGTDNLIDGNLIDGVGRWGIVFGPSGDPRDAAFATTGNVLSNNLIRNTSNRTNDTGAIYGGACTVDAYSDERLLITGNRIENVGGLAREISGRYDAGFAQGIYLDDHMSGATVTNNVIEGSGTYGVVLCHGCKGNSASNNVVILQPAPVYDRGTYGSTFATGEMIYNGTTRIDLLPSYFPEDLPVSTIVVQLSGQSSGQSAAAFDLLVDDKVIATGTATAPSGDYIFKVPLTPHQVHRVGIALTNGADTDPATTSLHNLGLIVNNTMVNLVAPEATSAFGSYGFGIIPDDLLVSNFSVTENIVYRNGGVSQDMFDMTSGGYPSYVDPEPGTINANILYQNVSPASDPIFGSQPLDANSVAADPMFANPSSGDYRILSGSPALALGFNPAGVPMAP